MTEPNEWLESNLWFIEIKKPATETLSHGAIKLRVSASPWLISLKTKLRFFFHPLDGGVEQTAHGEQHLFAGGFAVLHEAFG